jgi:hypothetical protein
VSKFRTCRSCFRADAPCEVRDTLSGALTGLGILSVKHRCPAYQPMHRPGDAVLVQTRAWIGGDLEEGYPPMCWYRGRFIRYVGAKALAFVEPGTEPENDEHPLESATGFIKVPYSRIRASDWASRIDVTACGWCAAILTIGQPCGRDPHYTPARSCLALQAEAA